MTEERTHSMVDPDSLSLTWQDRGLGLVEVINVAFLLSWRPLKSLHSTCSQITIHILLHAVLHYHTSFTLRWFSVLPTSACGLKELGIKPLSLYFCL